MRKQSTYQKRIAEIIPTTPAIDPRHVEGYMRCESNGTLDALSATRFRVLAIAGAVASHRDPKQAELLALSYGL